METKVIGDNVANYMVTNSELVPFWTNMQQQHRTTTDRPDEHLKLFAVISLVCMPASGLYSTERVAKQTSR